MRVGIVGIIIVVVAFNVVYNFVTGYNLLLVYFITVFVVFIAVQYSFVCFLLLLVLLFYYY